jgi:hypothetical protein
MKKALADTAREDSSDVREALDAPRDSKEVRNA